MILDHTEILRLIKEKDLIRNHDDSKLTNCAYTLRVGAVFEPDSGTKYITPPAPNGGGSALHWIIGPSECWVVMTKESFSLPSDLCGHYTPLYKIGRAHV